MASCLPVAGVVSLSLAAVLTVISVSTPFWLNSQANSTDDFHSGLWVQCVDQNCSSIESGPDTPIWFAVTRAVYAVVAANTVVGLVLGSLYLGCRPCQGSARTLQILLINLVITALEACMAITLFVARMDDHSYLAYDQPTTLAWSLILACCGGGWTTLSLILYILEAPNTKRRHDYKALNDTTTA